MGKNPKGALEQIEDIQVYTVPRPVNRRHQHWHVWDDHVSGLLA